jgi:molybdopterin converting factor small subunit
MRMNEMPFDSIALSINGKMAGFREKLNDGDVVFCMKPVVGG